MYPGFSEGSAYIVEQVAGRKVVAAVEYQVVTGQNRPCVFRSNSLRPTFERGVGREGREPLPGCSALGHSDLSFGVEHLSLEVALAHRVRVGQPDASHAGSRQVEGGGRAEPADADDQHRSLRQSALPPLPYFRQHRLPRVTFLHHQSKILSQSFQTTSYPSRRMSASTWAGVRSSLTENCSRDWG